MHAGMRRVQCTPGSAREVARRIEEGFVPISREIPGFVAYYFIDLGNDEVASISVFADQAGADEANRRASEWVKQNLASLMVTSLEARSGQILVNATAK
jgi:hypothetical protein